MQITNHQYYIQLKKPLICINTKNIKIQNIEHILTCGTVPNGGPEQTLTNKCVAAVLAIMDKDKG